MDLDSFDIFFNNIVINNIIKYKEYLYKNIIKNIDK